MTAEYTYQPSTDYQNLQYNTQAKWFSAAGLNFEEKVAVNQSATQIPRQYFLKSNVDTQQKRNPPPFLRNLWMMLNDRSITCINWSGINSFVVSNKEELIMDVLPRFFKHNRLTSFTQQLLTYEFVKVKKKGVLQWLHANLNRENCDSLLYIKRKHDKKALINVEALKTKMHEQKQLILALESRLRISENNLQFVSHKYDVIERQMMCMQGLLRNLACPGVNFA